MDSAGDELTYRVGGHEDLLAAARLYLVSFPETLAQIRAPDLTPHPVADVMAACLAAEPDCLCVAQTQGRLVGYVIAVVNVRRVWRAAVFRGLALRWVARWIRGLYRLPLRSSAILLEDQIAGWRSSCRSTADCPSRILSIAVAPEWRGRGVGTALLKAGLARLRRAGARCVRLEVRPTNVAARRMYERAGFRDVGRMRDARGEWEIMLLDLKTADAPCAS